MRILEGHRAAVRGVAFAPDGRTLASASCDGTVRVWDVAAGREVLRLRESPVGGPPSFLCVAFAPDGRVLAAGAGMGRVPVWELSEGEQILATRGTGGDILALAFAPNRRTLAFAERSHYSHGGFLLWDMARAESHPTRLGISRHEEVRCLAFAPDGGVLALGLLAFGSPISGEVRLWNLTTGRERIRVQGHENAVTSLSFSPDGTLLASGSADRTVRLWDPATGRRAVLRGHAQPVQCVAFSPDGRTLASAGIDAVVRLWDVASGSKRAVYDWGLGLVNCVAFAPDGMTAAAAGSSGAVFLWDVDDLR